MLSFVFGDRNARRGLIGLVAAATLMLGLQVATANAVVTGSNDAGAVAASIADGSPGLLTGASFTVAGPLAECANGEDDDGNGVVDLSDPGCKNATDDSEFNDLEDFAVPECQNKADDDGVEGTDLADPDCAAATDIDETTAGNQAPECTTAADDDGDGDGGNFPADPDCGALGDNDEFNVEECDNGTDDDGDGTSDLADGGCDFAYDDDESSENPPPASLNRQAGVSDGPLATFPTVNSTFGVLTSGSAELADDADSSGGSGTNNGGQAYGEAFDPVTLKLDINVPQGANCVGFDFRFLSEEYPEFVNAGFNDAFIAQLDQLSLTVTGQSITAPGDFAAGIGDRISVDSSGPSGMSNLFSAGTTYDGATPRLVAKTPVDPGAHSVFLTIFDAGDHILDSAVFVDNLRVSTEAPGQCKSLAVEPFEGKSGIGFGGDPANPMTLTSDLSQLQFLAVCNLPAGNELTCNPNFSFSFTPPGSSGKLAKRQAATPTPLATGSASIGAGQSQLISLPVTPEGKKAAQAALDRPAKLQKKAKKLLKKAKSAPAAKAKKLKKKAKKLKKQAKQLKAGPLGTVSGTVTNPVNGATDTVSFSVPR